MRRGVSGPAEDVTEGDISPRAMCVATFATLAAACAVGLSLIPYGGWWLIVVGLFVAVGVVAYSAGPHPALASCSWRGGGCGFFGLIPVCVTYMLVSMRPVDTTVACAAIGMGLMGANVILVNNFRDRRDDSAVGKVTIATLWPRPVIMLLYLFGGLGV